MHLVETGSVFLITDRLSQLPFICIQGILKKSIFLSTKPTCQELHTTFQTLMTRVLQLEGLANQNQELIEENQGLIKRN